MKRYLNLCFILLFLFTGCGPSEDGSIVWEFKSEYPVTLAPVVAGQNVYTGSDRFYCLNAKTGKKVWDFNTFGGFTTFSVAALVKDGRVYFQCGGLYCLDAETGKLIWDFWAGDWGDGQPAISDGYAYTNINKRLYCVDIKNGRKVWDVPSSKGLLSPPVISGGKIYIGSNGRILCLDAKTGKGARWINMGRGWLVPAAARGNIYIPVRSEKKLYCINAETGKIIWLHEFQSSFSPPAVTDRYVYASAETLYCFNAETGNIVWKSDTKLPYVYRPLMVFDNILCVMTLEDSAGIIFFDAETGKKLRVFKNLRENIVIKDGLIYFAKDYKVYCVRPD
jgi:outer membrane protein assembly factor BamB